MTSDKRVAGIQCRLAGNQSCRDYISGLCPTPQRAFHPAEQSGTALGAQFGEFLRQFDWRPKSIGFSQVLNLKSERANAAKHLIK